MLKLPVVSLRALKCQRPCSLRNRGGRYSSGARDEPTAVWRLPSILLCIARLPTAVLSKPVVLENSANAPSPVLLMPVVLLKSVPAPTAVFSFAVLLKSVPAPTPVLKLAAPLLRSAYIPNAELYIPPFRPARALVPSAVLLMGKGGGSGEFGGSTARVCGESAKQTIAIRI